MISGKNEKVSWYRLQAEVFDTEMFRLMLFE